MLNKCCTNKVCSFLNGLSKYAYTNGYDEIHLGGGLGGKTDGLYNFKKSFNRNKDNSYVVGKLIFNSELYGELIKGIEMDSYFPLSIKGKGVYICWYY